MSWQSEFKTGRSLWGPGAARIFHCRRMRPLGSGVKRQLLTQNLTSRLDNTVHYNTKHDNTIQYITLHYHTLQYISLQDHSFQFNSIPFNSVLPVNTIQSSTVQCSKIQNTRLQYNTLRNETILKRNEKSCKDLKGSEHLRYGWKSFRQVPRQC